jgi:hypothetical protein
MLRFTHARQTGSSSFVVGASGALGMGFAL